jgi:hypothetical protein
MDDGRPILWLRDAEELAEPAARRTVLWPAIEYTVLVFGREPERQGHELDPFERAVVGASTANVVSISEQARHLDLDVQFVAHLHRRLIERGIFDAHSRPRAPGTATTEVESQLAVHIYQDPWSGSLWPRFVPSDRRRTVPRSDADRRRILAGTTGAPFELPAFTVARPPRERETPSADDAIRALRTWTELCARHRLARIDLPRQRALRVIADTRADVLLCCPNERATGTRPWIQDPFGGPEWSPFIHALVGEARQRSGLAGWLFGAPESSPEANTATGAESGPRERLEHLEENWDRTLKRRNHRRAARIELEAIGIAAVQSLTAHRSREPLDVDGPESLDHLRSKIAWTVGFQEPDRWSRGSDEPTAVDEGSFADRCTALLLQFTPDRHGPLHRLADRCPDLFARLERSSDRWDPPSLEALREVVAALIDVVEQLDALEPTMEDA